MLKLTEIAINWISQKCDVHIPSYQKQQIHNLTNYINEQNNQQRKTNSTQKAQYSNGTRSRSYPNFSKGSTEQSVI